MFDSKTLNLYIDIDSLIDIRQGILKKLMKEDELIKYIHSDNYIHRIIDEFDVDMDKYREIYSSRDKSIIENSIISYTFNQLRFKIMKHTKTATNEHKVNGINILVNIYPFNLTNNEAHTLCYMLEKKLNIAVNVSPININLKELTPYFIKSTDIKELFIYDAADWLEYHSQALTTMPLLHNFFTFPALVKKKLSKEEEKKLKETGFTDIFALTEFVTSAMLTLNFNPMIYYNDVISASAMITKFLKLDNSLYQSLKFQGE